MYTSVVFGKLFHKPWHVLFLTLSKCCLITHLKLCCDWVPVGLLQLLSNHANRPSKPAQDSYWPSTQEVCASLRWTVQHYGTRLTYNDTAFPCFTKTIRSRSPHYGVCTPTVTVHHLRFVAVLHVELFPENVGTSTRSSRGPEPPSVLQHCRLSIPSV